jgi:uncharacterized membrane-anchored protein YitT (DUF2179 family)
MGFETANADESHTADSGYPYSAVLRAIPSVFSGMRLLIAKFRGRMTSVSASAPVTDAGRIPSGKRAGASEMDGMRKNAMTTVKDSLRGLRVKAGSVILGFMFMAGANICYVLAIQLFFAANNIAAGGFAGIATIVNYLIPIHIGDLVFLMNIPFVIVSFFVFKWKYTIKIFISIAMYTGVFRLLSFLPVATNDKFVACIFGGVLYAVGSVLIMYARTSAGGTDLVARLLLRKFKRFSLGRMFLAVDGTTVIFAIFVYRNLEAGVYAIAAIYVCSYVTDRILSGFDTADICYIITQLDPAPIGNAIMREFKIGVTKQKAEGMYGGAEKHVLMVVVRPKEIHRLKKLIVDYDPDAFVVIAWANEVRGGGFGNVSEMFK